MTEDEEYKRDCLARWMLNHWSTREERRASLDRMRANLAKSRGQAAADAFIADLEARMRREWGRHRKERAA